MSHVAARILAVALILAGTLAAEAAQPPSDRAAAYEAQRLAALETLREAKARGKTADDQVRSLIELAWPEASDDVSQTVSSLARERIVQYGNRVLPLLAQHLRSSSPRYGVDIVATMLETRIGASDFPPEYLPALDDALWFGSVEAQRLSMYELARYQYRPALLAMIDATYDHPGLSCSAIGALGIFRDDRARHFLREQLLGGPLECRELAARSLAAIGGRAADTLRQIAVSEDAQARSLAIDVLIPASSVDDLTILYEYLAAFPDDNAERLEKIRTRALQLEALFEKQQALEAATPSPDDY